MLALGSPISRRSCAWCAAPCCRSARRNMSRPRACIGNSEVYSMLRHVLPNAVAPVAVLATSMFGWVLLAESALSFLGLGVPPPAPTWGNMLAASRPFMETAPWLSHRAGPVHRADAARHQPARRFPARSPRPEDGARMSAAAHGRESAHRGVRQQRCGGRRHLLRDRTRRVPGRGRRVRQRQDGGGARGARPAAVRPSPRPAAAIVLDGVDLATVSARDMRALRGPAVGMVFQEPMVSLNPAISVGAQMAEGLGLHAADREARDQAALPRHAGARADPRSRADLSTPIRTNSPAACASASCWRR